MLTKEQLLSPKTRIVDLDGLGKVEIRKLKLFEINPHGNKKQDDATKSYNLISSSLTNPELSPSDVKNLEFDVFSKIQDEVLDFNGLTDDSEKAIEKN